MRKDRDEVTDRFIEVTERLREDKFIKSDRELANKLGTYFSKINKIKTGELKADIPIITNLCNVFEFVNIEFIMLGKGKMFLSSNSNDHLEDWLEEQGVENEAERKILVQNIAEYYQHMLKKFKMFQLYPQEYNALLA
jgi:hypothetical protein